MQETTWCTTPLFNFIYDFDNQWRPCWLDSNNTAIWLMLHKLQMALPIGGNIFGFIGYWWVPTKNLCLYFGARRKYLQCVSNGDTPVLHQAIDMMFGLLIKQRWKCYGSLTHSVSNFTTEDAVIFVTINFSTYETVERVHHYPWWRNIL